MSTNTLQVRTVQGFNLANIVSFPDISRLDLQ